MWDQQAIETMIAGHQQIIAGLEQLRVGQALAVAPADEDFDPKDPANKHDVGGWNKLTPRGVEICYRLFDAGKSRYAVAALMDMSFGAATHRYNAWLKAGGRNRKKEPLS
jgi:hypothetical protein